MTTKTDSATWRGVCAGCGYPFTEWAWSHRHDINETDAHLHSLDVGDYHDQCCPLPACTATDSGEVTVA